MKKKIMILEDDEATSELIRFYLEEDGFQVSVHDRGGGFADKVADFQPDLITLDIMLPDTDGFSLFQHLQQDTRTRNIPVIFISVLEKEKNRGIKLGAKGYVVKPFNENELKQTIKSVFEGDL